jgi:hypothetical protein
MLASTMQFSNNNPSQHPTHTPQRKHKQACPGKPETPTTTPHQQQTTHRKKHGHATHPPAGSSPCCLRTQQCAIHHRTSNQPALSTTHTHNPHKEGKQTRSPYSNQPAPTRHLSVDIPPMSTHRRTNACAMGLLLTTPTPHTTRDMNSCRRSLERR